MFYPQSDGRTVFKDPTNCKLRIDGCVMRKLLAAPNCFDSNGKPCLIVMKDGNATDLTVGCYAGLEAYLCNDLGIESIELAIYTTTDCIQSSSASPCITGLLVFQISPLISLHIDTSIDHVCIAPDTSTSTMQASHKPK